MNKPSDSFEYFQIRIFSSTSELSWQFSPGSSAAFLLWKYNLQKKSSTHLSRHLPAWISPWISFFFSPFLPWISPVQHSEVKCSHSITLCLPFPVYPWISQPSRYSGSWCCSQGHGAVWKQGGLSKNLINFVSCSSDSLLRVVLWCCSLQHQSQQEWENCPGSLTKSWNGPSRPSGSNPGDFRSLPTQTHPWSCANLNEIKGWSQVRPGKYWCGRRGF